MLGSEKNRQQELGEVLRLSPGLLQPRIELARSQIGGGKAQAASDLLDSAPKNQKSAAALAATRNWALLALNHADEAGADAENALKTQRIPELVLQRGIAKFLKKDFVGARTDAQEILRTNAADSGALSLAIQACLADKQNALALQILNESTAKNSASPRMQLVAGEWLRQPERRPTPGLPSLRLRR